MRSHMLKLVQSPPHTRTHGHVYTHDVFRAAAWCVVYSWLTACTAPHTDNNNKHKQKHQNKQNRNKNDNNKNNNKNLSSLSKPPPLPSPFAPIHSNS
mmetsp:Transcript_9011/g.10128  ORF Transcript_9011/g.10128 Transcript_9011/m.10128 type:complete len:97 (+) Transcript_9011:751-1041(+)